jgi:hypothetical protein
MTIEIILMILVVISFFIGHSVGWKAGYKHACWKHELEKKIKFIREQQELAKPHHEGGHL